MATQMTAVIPSLTLVSGAFAGLLGLSRNGAKKNAQINKEALLNIKEIRMDCRETKIFVKENRDRITKLENYLIREKGKETN